MNWTSDSQDCEFTLSDSGYWIELVKTDDGLSDQKALEQGKVKLDSSYKKINGFDWKAGFRSIYYNPLTPDAGLDHLAGYSYDDGYALFMMRLIRLQATITLLGLLVCMAIRPIRHLL